MPKNMEGDWYLYGNSTVVNNMSQKDSPKTKIEIIGHYAISKHQLKITNRQLINGVGVHENSQKTKLINEKKASNGSYSYGDLPKLYANLSMKLITIDKKDWLEVKYLTTKGSTSYSYFNRSDNKLVNAIPKDSFKSQSKSNPFTYITTYYRDEQTAKEHGKETFKDINKNSSIIN